MPFVIKQAPDAAQKLNILSQDSRFDLACACATRADEHRSRSKDGKWVYPVVLPNGGTTFLFKTLLSNECVNNCKYCPLRSRSAAEPCSMTPDELVSAFSAYYRAGKVSGLFLSSGVRDNPDATMERINQAAAILRARQFKGYIHLKVIPGASEAAVRQSLSLATTVSLNVETAGADNFRLLGTSKDYGRDILPGIGMLSRLTAKGAPFAGVRKTTQFVVGAARETDRDIMALSGSLYRREGFNRVYFSAYQRGRGAADLPGEISSDPGHTLLTREHRLYQADWLMRKYGFTPEEIPVGDGGNLSLSIDPKEDWAKRHPEFFPVDINRDDKMRLLRVPGLGHVTVDKIMALRSDGHKIRSLGQLGRLTRTLAKAAAYLEF